jgi:hypothetical protein
VRVPADQKARAKEQGLATLTLTLNDQHCPRPTFVLEVAGAIPPECAEELRASLQRWIEEGKL